MIEPLTKAELLKKLMQMFDEGVPLNERLNFAKLYTPKKRGKANDAI